MKRIDAEEGAHQQMTLSDDLCERAKKRCVGILADEAVYFVGTRTSFHLAIECSPGQFRRLSETEHLRFRKQNRIEGLCYGQYWEQESPLTHRPTGTRM